MKQIFIICLLFSTFGFLSAEPCRSGFRPESGLRGEELRAKTWELLEPYFIEKINHFRIQSKQQQQNLLIEAGLNLNEAFENVLGHHQVGFHFNLHGGDTGGYLSRGGILKSKNEASSYIGGKDFIPPLEAPKDRVYFFSNADYKTPADILNLRPSFFQSRYGNVLVIFDLARFEGENAEVVEMNGGIFLEFKEQHSHNRLAVGSEYFVLPPMPVFRFKRLDSRLRLDRNTETYLQLLILREMILVQRTLY